MDKSILFWISFFLFYSITIVYVIYSIIKHKNKKVIKHKEEATLNLLRERERALNASAILNSIILETLEYDEVINKISNSLPKFFGYETGVLALVDESRGVLKRVGLSDTSGSIAAIKVLEKPFGSIEIKLNAKENITIRALREKRAMHTSNLYDVLRPEISKENSKIIQEHMGTKTTLVFPIFSSDTRPLGVFLASMSKEYDEITDYEHQTIKNFIDSVRIALNNALLYKSLIKTTDQLRRANRRLKELDKLKDEFVSVASHELRTPMTAIKSYLWMALDGKGGSLSEKQRYYIQRGYNSVDRLIRLVNDMLNISRIESGRITVIRKPTDLQVLIQEVVDEVTPRAQEVGVNVIFKKSPEEEIVIADGDKMKEVLFNLIGNSIKFTPPKGTIMISINHNDGFIETVVTDTGTGISAEDLGKLFQKFGLLAGSYTTNQPAMGTGLGLYISKSIMNMHEGKIWAASEGKGKGATFTFALKKPSKKDIEEAAKEKHEDKEDVGIIHSSV